MEMSTDCPKCAKHAHKTLQAIRALDQVRQQVKTLDARIEDIVKRLDTQAVNDDAIVEFSGVPHRFMEGSGWVRI